MAFRLFGFPVKVELGFFVVAAFLGMSTPDAAHWLLWVAAVFVGVLVHELGHALMGRWLGLQPAILLHTFGGETSWNTGGRRLSDNASIMVSLAGPFAGFLVGGLVFGVLASTPTPAPLLLALASYMLWVNIGWGVLNLLPILPLDGGNIMRSVVHKVRGYRDEVTPYKVSIAVGAAGALLALVNGFYWAGMMAGFITWGNWTALQRLRGMGL